MTPGSLWNSFRDEVNDDVNEINDIYRVNNEKTITSKSFEYKTKIIGSATIDNNTLDTEGICNSRVTDHAVTNWVANSKILFLKIFRVSNTIWKKTFA